MIQSDCVLEVFLPICQTMADLKTKVVTYRTSCGVIRLSLREPGVKDVSGMSGKPV